MSKSLTHTIGKQTVCNCPRWFSVVTNEVQTGDMAQEESTCLAFGVEFHPRVVSTNPQQWSKITVSKAKVLKKNLVWLMALEVKGQATAFGGGLLIYRVSG